MWEYIEEFNENEYFGFVYKIENLINGMFYFGKKQFSFRRKTKLKSKKYSKVKTIKSDWENYWGSSKVLLDDIKIHGKENFKRTIIKLCKTKSEQTYYENYYIYENHNLLNPLCYNKHIGHVYAKNILDQKIIMDKESKIKEIDDENILNDYNNGLNLKEICSKYKIGMKLVYEVIPKEIRGINKLKGKNWNEDTLNNIKELYSKNISMDIIGKQLNLDSSVVRYILNTKLNILTNERDLRNKRPKGIRSKPIILLETNQIFERGIQGAHEELKISKTLITKSLKENITYKGFTFRYYQKDFM